MTMLQCINIGICVHVVPCEVATILHVYWPIKGWDEVTVEDAAYMYMYVIIQYYNVILLYLYNIVHV